MIIMPLLRTDATTYNTTSINIKFYYREYLVKSNVRRRYKELQKTDWKGEINKEKRTTKDPRKKRR